ncbi:MAG: hypothetical protein KJP05_00755 [Deltaproteobacteria bacterium]|nr:hypothetical protein [Deltaproteobacteria bacterium]
MKKNKASLKAEFLAKAEALFDELMTWDETTPRPNLTQIEDVVLQLRQQFGEELTQAVLARQESRQPAEKMSCPHCGGETQHKGQKDNHIASRVGGLRIERTYYYCPRCQQGFFPPGSAAGGVGETLE